VVCIAEFDEGPWWWAPLLNFDETQLREGLELELVFVPTPGGYILPAFQTADEREHRPVRDVDA
jgi:hypothetical protein